MQAAKSLSDWCSAANFSDMILCRLWINTIFHISTVADVDLQGTNLAYFHAAAYIDEEIVSADAFAQIAYTVFYLPFGLLLSC